MEIARAKRITSIHLRNESVLVLEALSEVLEYAKQTKASLHISHAKIMGQKNWKLFEKYLSLLEEAVKDNVRVSFDVFPYNYTGTVLYTLLPDWVSEGGRYAMLQRLKERFTRRQIKVEMQKTGIEYKNIYLLGATFLDRSLTKKSLAQIACARNGDPEDAIMDILLSSEGRAIVRMDVLSEEHIEKAIQHPLSIIASDGAGYSIDHRQTGETIHPRCFGCFPRFLSHYVQERKLLSWQEAIYKITGFPARRFGIEKRGILQEGNYADIVVFDPENLKERATIQNPYQYAQGIEHLIINGELVLKDAVYREKKAGMIIRKE
jgi:N-acyl-D-amino-acid deacylase